MLLPSPFVLNKFSLWARPEDPHWASGPGRASVTTAYTKNPYIHVYIYIYIHVYLYIGHLKNILASILTVTAQNVASQSICFEQVFIVGQA